MAKMTDLPSVVTLESVASNVIQLHQCVEDFREQSATKWRGVERKINNQNRAHTLLVKSLGETRANQFAMAADITELKAAIVRPVNDNQKPKRSIMLMGQGELLLKLGSLLGFVIGAWKFAVFSAPYVCHYIAAVYQQYWK